MVMRDGENVHDENTYLTAKKADQDSEWKQVQADITSLIASEEDYVLFLGEKGGLMENSCEQMVFLYKEKCSLPYHQLQSMLQKKRKSILRY